MLLAQLKAREGDQEAARELVARVGGDLVDSSWSGIIYAMIGDRDRAFEALDEALDGRPSLWALYRSLLLYMKVGPWFDLIRSDPRFEGLLRRMNLLDA